MPRTCTICADSRRTEIDLALTGHTGSLRAIAKRYSLSKSALQRHLHGCLPTLHEAMREALAHAETKTVLVQMAELHARTLALLTVAEAAGELDTALRGVREARNNLRLLAEMDGSLNPAATPGKIEISVHYVDRQVVVAPGDTSARCIESINAPAGEVEK
jgi:hypothetical protein